MVKVTGVRALPNFNLDVTFNDGESALVDLSREVHDAFPALAKPGVWEKAELFYGDVIWTPSALGDPSGDSIGFKPLYLRARTQVPLKRHTGTYVVAALMFGAGYAVACVVNTLFPFVMGLGPWAMIPKDPHCVDTVYIVELVADNNAVCTRGQEQIVTLTETAAVVQCVCR